MNNTEIVTFLARKKILSLPLLSILTLMAAVSPLLILDLGIGWG